MTQVPTTFGGVPRQFSGSLEPPPVAPPPSTSRLRGRKPLLALVGALLVVVLAGLAGWRLLAGSGDQVPTAVATRKVKPSASAPKKATPTPARTTAAAVPRSTYDPFYVDAGSGAGATAGATTTGASTAGGSTTGGSTTGASTTGATTSPAASASPAPVYVSLVGWMSGPMADLWINAKHQPLGVGSSFNGVKLVAQLPPDTTGQVCARVALTANAKITATLCPGTSVALA